ncbi:hypothetical protein EV580_1352 [Mycobacterium sp. BK086]|uniref:hypothetical protein n=1 Tax=Mycobacterium sp. BK086 TaxID=2512165 RepID=UPI0010D09068|nr:hypothetical protein [Mycobacterium sp. BK086]TDO18168.1 hypothetical protein EV580_1352 [Mycobacterium sp. BK086]
MKPLTWLIGACCGDCEMRPCVCPWSDDYDDLWIPGLADYDDVCAVHHREIREVA